MPQPNRTMIPASAIVDSLFDDFTPDPASAAPVTAQKAVHLARRLQQRAGELQTPQEKRQQAELDRMIHNPGDKATLMELTDQAFRSRVPQRAIDQLVHILDVQGVPRFFSPLERTLLKGFQSFGNYLPGVAAPLVKHKMHQETANVILPAERDVLAKHLAERRGEGVRMNVNYLGEALLGEEDAQARLKSYLKALQQPEIEVISIKISTIYSQVSSLAAEHTIRELTDRLELLFRAAAKERFTRADGAQTPKFVYLDMEEYRDMHLTAAAFMRTLDRPGLGHVAGGIALQAYIPDSFAVQQRITQWAQQRVARGGAAVTIRIVKGANMEMERVEASLNGWPQAPYQRKIETDANYHRMLEYGLTGGRAAAVRLGIASHNLFALSYGLVLAIENDALGRVQFEMLEGMANHQRRALFELVRNMLLYAPACTKANFIHAIGYLVRRLDENTGPDNFLRHAFKLQVDSDDWRELEGQFLASFERGDEVSAAPRRTQDRRAEVEFDSIDPCSNWTDFRNEPDTDFSLPHNVEWAKRIVEAWLPKHGDNATDIPLEIAGEDVSAGRDVYDSTDPSRPGAVIARWRHATPDDIRHAVACAKADDDGWRKLAPQQHRNVLRKAAHELRRARAGLIGAAMIDGGKLITESDPEVSEAIDFCEFYSLTARHFRSMPGLSAAPAGVVVVISPWNFPIAIPCGGVAAALAAGNTVILKPAPDTVLVAYELCKCFWRAGVSKKALQLLPCFGKAAGEHLVGHPDVDAAVFTGGTDTARKILADHPHCNLLAETGGKNATIVTALSDRDQAIKNVIHSAFSHGGQKCSATSLLILEEEVYEDEGFKRTLIDAVRSMRIGPAHEFHTRIGPLIKPPKGHLENALKELEPGEEWALLPEQDDDNPQLWTPGVKYGVRPGSYTHTTEFFGPVLGVMKAKNLDEAIEIVNTTGYGLTSGLESLDDREQALWRDTVRAGNLYINRGTTGAIVLRQPFGGMGKSAFGPGIKAGGPNYVAQLMRFGETGEPEGVEPDNPHVRDLLAQLRTHQETASEDERAQIADAIVAIRSYARHFAAEFGREHDHFRLIGQDNIRRYLPVKELRVRVHGDDTLFELLARVAAARTARCRVTVSFPHEADSPHVELLDRLTDSWAGAIEFVEESDEQLAQVVLEHQTDRLRYAARDRVPLTIRNAAPKVNLFIADAPVLRHGRIELLWYVMEQSICDNYHRYGNLGRRGGEERAEVL